MPIFSALVVFAFVWFITLLCVLTVRLKTQGETGSILPGTSPSSPSDVQMGKRLLWTTIIAVVVWLAIVAVILSGVITLENMDIVNRWVHRGG